MENEDRSLEERKKCAQEYLEREYYIIISFGCMLIGMLLIVISFIRRVDNSSVVGIFFIEPNNIFFLIWFLLLYLALLSLWIFLFIRLTRKRRMLNYLINGGYSYQTEKAICIDIVRRNLIGIRYTFLVEDKDVKNINLYAYSEKNYILDVRVFEAVYIQKYFNTYFIVFPIHKPQNTEISFGRNKFCRLVNTKRTQRLLSLIGLITSVIIIFINCLDKNWGYSTYIIFIFVCVCISVIPQIFSNYRRMKKSKLKMDDEIIVNSEKKRSNLMEKRIFTTIFIPSIFLIWLIRCLIMMDGSLTCDQIKLVGVVIASLIVGIKILENK